MQKNLNFLKCDGSYITFLLILSVLGLFIVINYSIFYGLSEESQILLKLNMKDLRFWQIITSTFVHDNQAHITNNIIFFLIGSILGLILSIYARILKEYLLMILITIIGFPIFWGILKIFFINSILPSWYNCGSSGIVAAFIGFLPILFISVVSRFAKLNLLNWYYTITFFLFVVYSLLEALKTTNMSLSQLIFYYAIIIALLICWVVYLLSIITKIKNRLSRNGYFAIITSIFSFMLLYLIFMGSIFPQQFVLSTSRVGIEIHLLGVIFGLFLSSVIVFGSQGSNIKIMS